VHNSLILKMKHGKYTIMRIEQNKLKRLITQTKNVNLKFKKLKRKSQSYSIKSGCKITIKLNSCRRPSANKIIKGNKDDSNCIKVILGNKNKKCNK